MTVKAILAEMQSWRSRLSQRDRIRARPRDQEHPDPVPIAVPVGYDLPPTMDELIRQYVRQEVSQQASADGMGTFEEEDDFELTEHNPLPLGNFDVNEFEMDSDPDMPEVAPVEPEPGGTPPSDPPPVDGAPAPPGPAGAPSPADGEKPPVAPSVLT